MQKYADIRSFQNQYQPEAQARNCLARILNPRLRFGLVAYPRIMPLKRRLAKATGDTIA